MIQCVEASHKQKQIKRRGRDREKELLTIEERSSCSMGEKRRSYSNSWIPKTIITTQTNSSSPCSTLIFTADVIFVCMHVIILTRAYLIAQS